MGEKGVQDLRCTQRGFVSDTAGREDGRPNSDGVTEIVGALGPREILGYASGGFSGCWSSREGKIW